MIIPTERTEVDQSLSKDEYLTLTQTHWMTNSIQVAQANLNERQSRLENAYASARTGSKRG